MSQVTLVRKDSGSEPDTLRMPLTARLAAGAAQRG
jgi:hypothetical protein